MAQDHPFRQLFREQLGNCLEVGQTSARERNAKLQALEKALQTTYRKAIRTALHSDFRKPPLETDLTEIYPVVSEIRHIRRNLRDWMRDERVPTPAPMIGSRSFIRYEPRGVCLILAPWNYPLNLTLGPLVSAIAAGNCCIVKPSEFAPATSAVLAEILESLFDPSEIAVVRGDVKTATALLELPFHHIFFTGSPRVGKIVMAAAAKNLSSVTLELGGKSPVYIGASASVKTAARRLAWGKFSNAGQICIAPDYILVHSSVREQFIAELKEVLQAAYPGGALASRDFASLISKGHFNRLDQALDQAVNAGASVLFGGERDAANNRLAPTLIANVPVGCELRESEIFGPILPIIEVTGPGEALDYISQFDRPLALYLFSNNRREIRMLLSQTRAGGSCINHTILQYGNHHLPFGGINHSGFGKSHGKFGFRAFSNARGVVRQFTPGAADFLRAPYSRFKQRMVDFTLRWF